MPGEVQGLSLVSFIQKRVSLLYYCLFVFVGKKYVDVLNPSGQNSSGSAVLPSSFLPTFPSPVTEFNPAQMFVPAPVPGNLVFLKIEPSARETRIQFLRTFRADMYVGVQVGERPKGGVVVVKLWTDR